MYKEVSNKTIRVTFEEHAVLLIGYNKKHCYLNNPLTGEKQQKVRTKALIKVWESMGKRAVSYA